MPSPGWLTTDPLPKRPDARPRPGWAPRPQGKVKLATGWSSPETGAGADAADPPTTPSAGIQPNMPLAPKMPVTSPWSEDQRRGALPSMVPGLTAPSTPAIPSTGSSTSSPSAAPSPGSVGVPGTSAAAPAPSPARVPPQGGQGAAQQPTPPARPPQTAWTGFGPDSSQRSNTPTLSLPNYPSSATTAMPTPQPKTPGDYIDQARQAAIAAGIDPDVFARQIQQESGFNPNAKSGAGALGIAQFMPDTAKGLNVNPLDPKASLTAAAGLMKSYLDKYKGDYRKALAAYNAGPGNVDKYGDVPPFPETQTYVDKIYGQGGAQSNPQSSPQAVHKTGQGNEVSQFELGLSTSDAYAFCGPAAAMAFAATYGRNPTATEAKALAQKVGWNPSTGMAGVGSEQKLLESMDIATRLEDKINWDHVANDASNGNPVIIDTPGHYYFVDGYDANTGKYHVGKSGTDLKGGGEWMSASQIDGMPQSGGPARSALYADHPLSSTPSMYVPGRSAPNDTAAGWGGLPTTFTLGMGGGWVAGAGQGEDDQNPLAGWVDQGKQAIQQALDPSNPFNRQYPVLGPGGLGLWDPRIGPAPEDQFKPDTGDIGTLDLASSAHPEDPGAYAPKPGYDAGLGQGPSSPSAGLGPPTPKAPPVDPTTQAPPPQTPAPPAPQTPATPLTYPTQYKSTKWKPPGEASDRGKPDPQTGLTPGEQTVLQAYKDFAAGKIDDLELDSQTNLGLATHDPNDILTYAINEAALYGRREFLDQLPTVGGHQMGATASDAITNSGDPNITTPEMRATFKAQFGDKLKPVTPISYRTPLSFSSADAQIGGAGEIHTAGVYMDTDFKTADDRFSGFKKGTYSRVYDLKFKPGDVLDMRNDPDAAGIMADAHQSANTAWGQRGADDHRDFGQVLRDELKSRGYKAIYGGGYESEYGELALLDSPEDMPDNATLVADGRSRDVMPALKNYPGWNPQTMVGMAMVPIIFTGAEEVQIGNDKQGQGQGAGQDDGEDLPWWERAGQAVLSAPGAIASGIGTVANTAAQGAASVVQGAANAVQNTPDIQTQATPLNPSGSSGGNRTIAEVADQASQADPTTQPTPDAYPSPKRDLSALLTDQGQTLLPHAGDTSTPPRRALQDTGANSPLTPPAAGPLPGQFALPQPPPDKPTTAIERVTRGDTGRAQASPDVSAPSDDPVTQAARSIMHPGAQASFGQTVSNIARDPVVDISDDGYRGQLRKAAEKAIINVDGGPLQMLFDPTIAAFGTQAPVEVAINAIFGMDPLTGVVANKGIGLAGRGLGRMVAPIAPARAVVQAAQKVVGLTQKPGEAVFGLARTGTESLLTRGLDKTILGSTGRTLTDHFGADEQADVLEAAGAYLRDRSLDAEALRLRRMTTLIKPVTGRELEAQVRILAQKAGKPELADEILRNAGYSELTQPYTQAVQRLASRPAQSVPEIARGATNMLVGGTLGAAMTGIYANDKNDPSYNSKLTTGTFIGAAAMIGMPYAQVLSKTITPKVLETAQELFGNFANLKAPTQAVVRDYLQSKAVIEFRQKLMAEDIRTAFGPKEEWSSVFQHMEETGNLPPQLAGDPIAKQVWQDILDSNARAVSRGDVGDVTAMSAKTPGFNGPQAFIHHAVDDEWAAAKRGAERYDPTPPNRGPRSNPISQYNKPREWATTREGEAQPSPVKYNYSLDEILPNQWAAQQMQALNEVLEGNLRGMAVDPTTMSVEDALNHDVLAIPEGATGYFKPKGYDQGNSIISDLHISRQLRSSLNRIYGDRGGISGVPGLGKVYDGVTRFFGGMKLGMIAGSAFHLVNEWHQFGAAMGGLDAAETHIPELTQMALSKGAWREFVSMHRDDLAKAVADGMKFDPFSEPVNNTTTRVIQAGLLGGGGYVGGFQAAKRAGKTDQEAAAWGAIGAGMGAGMALPFFGENGALVDLFTDSLFKRTIPMMKFQVYLAHGATPEAASFANEAFGDINTDAILRSRWFSDTARLAGFAPQWTEGFWRQTGRALWDTGTTGQTARKFWASAAMNGMFMLQGLNLALSGHWSWQNEPGHETEVETTGLMDRNGYNRVPANSLSGVPQRTYLDILPAWRSLITPPLETSKWLLAAAASTPQGQQLGLDNPHITGRENGTQVYPAPDPAKAFSSYLTNRSGLIPNTLNNLFSDTDFRGQPLNLPTDSAMDQAMRRIGSALQSLAPMSPAQGITQAIQGEPLPMVALSAATGMRTSTVNPGAVRAQTEAQVRQQTTGKTPAQQRELDQQRLEYNHQQDLSALQATQDPNQTAADRLKVQRDYPHINLPNYVKAQVPPEVMMQHPDTVVGMLAQVDAINKAAATSASEDPADPPAVMDTDPDTLFQQAWNQDPSKLQGLTPDQQWQVRQQWTVQTARNAGLDEKVVEDIVKSHLYGMEMPAVPGVSSLELDTLADEWKQTGDGTDPISQHAQRQTMLNDYAKQKGIDPNALSERVRLRILLAGDQTGQQQSYSRALTVLEAAHNPATAPEYMNADGTAMGTPDDWVQWDKKLAANNDKYDKIKGKYTATDLQILSDAKTRGATKPADIAYRSKGYWDYQRWFGVGRNMTDAQFSQYRAGTLDMWSDHPDAKEAQNRADILELYKTLTPDQRTKAMVQIQWHGKNYNMVIGGKYGAIHTLGLVKNNKWQDEGLDPGIEPGAPGVDTGFQ